MSDTPSLPAPYEFVHLAEVDSVRAELRRRAEAGAEEGLLLRADRQTGATGRLDQPWRGAPGDLACGVLLRPDFDRERAAELSLVATFAAGQAIGPMLAALTGLHYQWPNDVLLNGAKAAAVWIDAPAAGDPPAWLAITLAVHVLDQPDDETLRATSLRAQEAEVADADELLGAWSRHLLAGLNRWAEDGLGATLRGWRARLFDIAHEQVVRLPEGRTLAGRPLGIDDDGALRLGAADGEHRVGLREFWGF